eukprot:TRINITY_DN358_c6_g1_i1.p1 TRINITY_DN358_c6_g1~~TRINITY_DN358_c6_g1_i1.p1  ORF type:complete len:404 (+),score=60.67 TRINITY_DN358_c6_g1_i1:105-1316(+)
MTDVAEQIKVPHNDVLNWLMRRLVDRERNSRRGSGDAPSSGESVAETVAKLRVLFAEMMDTCTEKQMNRAQESAVKILLVGRHLNLQLYTKVLGDWLQRVKSWPKEGSEVKLEPKEAKTIRKSRSTFISSPSNELIKIKYTNPLPVPDFDSIYTCVVCGNDTITSAYQAVNCDSERDRGTFTANESGLDVCVNCVTMLVHKSRGQLLRRVKSCPYGKTKRIRAQGLVDTSVPINKVLHLRGTPGLSAVVVVLEQNKHNLLHSALRHGYYETVKFEGSTDTCSICMESLMHDCESRGPPIMTPCRHVFHSLCLRTLLRGVDGATGTNECPNCRSNVPTSKASTFKVALAPATVKLTMDATGDNIDESTSYDIVTILCQELSSIAESAIAVNTQLLPAAVPSFWQ